MTDESGPGNAHRPVYIERVNAAIDYIEGNLTDDLTLDQLAAVAHFSPFHFHRLFTLLAGETLGRFIGRLRLERAATQLLQQPTRAVTDVASACGMPSPSSFARAFKEMFGMSATEWRRGGYASYAGEQSVRDLLGDVGVLGDGYGITKILPGDLGSNPQWEIACDDLPPTIVAVVDVPDLDVAYVRHTGRYQGNADVFADIYNRLMTWAMPRQLVKDDSWIMSVYHDNPSITDDDKLRVSACIDVPPETPRDGDLGRMFLPGGACAIARFELGALDYGKAWFAVAGGWLPDSGYEPDDRLPFERFPTNAATTSADTEVVDICIPVRPLRRF